MARLLCYNNAIPSERAVTRALFLTVFQNFKGGRIDRYITKMPFISPLIMRLLNKRKGHFYLKNNDLNSLDYKFALFSCFWFLNDYNTKLFELKLLQWEENNKQ